MQHYDLIVIGSGAALIVLEAALAKGKRCALIERDKFGGTCLNRGCIPSKILVHPADLIRESERGAKIGVRFAPPTLDWQTISKRMWDKIGENRQILAAYQQMENLTVYQGSGTFTGDKVLQVRLADGTLSDFLTAPIVVIGCGGRARTPDIEGLEQTGYINYERFFGDQFPEKPYKRLLIIGGGVIGTEFAHIFAAYGSEVTIIDHNPRLAKHEEPEISALLEAEFSRVGIRIRTHVEPVAAEIFKGKYGREKRLTVRHKLTDAEEVLACDEILIAAGFLSNSDQLRTDHCGLALDSRGYIQTNEHLETNVPGVYALGDINGKHQYRHKANYEAYILANNLFEPDKPLRTAYYDRVPYAIFTHPQIAHVGLTEKEALEEGYDLLTGKNYYSSTAKGYAMGYLPGDADDGFVKLVVSKDHIILGVHIIGPQASVLIQPFIYLMNKGLRCQAEDLNQLESRLQSHDPGHTMLRPHLCFSPDSIATIDQSMVIHPALSEVAAWATGYLQPVEKPKDKM